jgi:hypothetical protein
MIKMPSKVADRVFPQALNFKTDSAISYTKFSLEIVLEGSDHSVQSLSFLELLQCIYNFFVYCQNAVTTEL